MKLFLIFFLLSPISSIASIGSVGFVLPNFYSIHIGERGSVLGGAVVARVDDASSAHYNPAGLAMLPKNSFSASGSTYTSTALKISDSKSANTLNSVASFVANVIKFEDIYFAFSVSTPIYSETTLTSPQTVPNIDINGNQKDQVNFNIIAPGFSFAKNFSNYTRMGVSLKMYIASFKSNNAIYLDSANSTAEATAFQTISSSANLLRLEWGIQHDLSRNVRVGILLKSPTKVLTSKGEIDFGSLVKDSSSPTTVTTYTKGNSNELDSTLKLPTEAHFGIAYIDSQWDLELDLKLNDKVTNRAISSKDVTATTITHQDGSADTKAEDSLEMPQFNFRRTVNLSVSSSFKLGSAYLISGSFFTDRSPSKRLDIENDLFTSIDFYGATIGVTRFTQVASTTLGLFVSKGSTTYSKNNILDEIVQQKIDAQNIGITLAGSVYF